MPDILSFEGWPAPLRIIAAGILTYAGILLFIHLSGKRSLAKLSVFDFVITIALGSILSTTALQRDITYAQGLTAAGLFLGLQFLIASLSRQSSAFKNLIFIQPSLLYYRGKFIQKALQRTKITQQEIHAAVRQHGRMSMHGVGAIVFEADGTISVIGQSDAPDEKMLEGVRQDIDELDAQS